MNIYPAIDLRNGKCVRLYQGDYQKETIYENNPFSMIKHFENEGAAWLHIVDLDGALNPEKNQSSLISELIRSTTIKIQTGGGIRSIEQIQILFESGVERLIIGSLAVKNPEEVTQWFDYFGGEKLVLAFDVFCKQNQTPTVAVDAWQNYSKQTLFEIIAEYRSKGLKHVICTDISRDGTLEGPNLELYKTLVERFQNIQFQASGGIKSLSDLKNIKKLKLSGAIIGRALYEKQFSLKEALSC